MNKRIIGIDVARAFAVMGMIIVNFKMVLGHQGQSWMKPFSTIFDGKAAATFVVLAGVGIAFMTNSAIKNSDHIRLRKTQKDIFKRALFLFVIGLSYLFIWSADILHFYGVYMLVTLIFIKSSPRRILFSSLLLILIYPVLMFLLDYELGWDFVTYEYADFWTAKGFFRNLLYNGFHPVIPWSAFMLVGLWLGRQDLNNDLFVKKLCWISLLLFTVANLISIGLIRFLSQGNESVIFELSKILGTSPMPPLPIYMISGSSIAVFVISSCILMARRFENNRIIKALTKTGQLALTFYVAHVVIGMGVIEKAGPMELGMYSLEFSVIYALFFSTICIVFAVIWLRYKKMGPLEWIMRKLTS